jgi:hypothetical protein
MLACRRISGNWFSRQMLTLADAPASGDRAPSPSSASPMGRLLPAQRLSPSQPGVHGACSATRQSPSASPAPLAPASAVGQSLFG